MSEALQIMPQLILDGAVNGLHLRGKVVQEQKYQLAQKAMISFAC